MGKPVRPRFGSMGVWPRKRSKTTYAAVRSYAQSKEAKPLGFPTYKAGMTKVIAVGQQKGSRGLGQEQAHCVTVLVCPPIKIASARLYKKKDTAQVVSRQLNFKVDKELLRKIPTSKKDTTSADDLAKLNPDDYSNITIQVYTTPKTTGIKKTPDLFEIELGGSLADKIEFIKAHIDKPIQITDVFKEGQLVDAHAVTTGRGFQGPVKRFGVGMTAHKSEKARRNPGSLGGWKAQAHVMYRVAHAGQTGYHKRTQYNNLVLKISDKPEEVNPKGGFVNFGEVKTTYILVKGSIPGPKKRMITLTEPIRPKKITKFTSDSIKSILTKSQQSK